MQLEKENVFSVHENNIQRTEETYLSMTLALVHSLVLLSFFTASIFKTTQNFGFVVAFIVGSGTYSTQVSFSALIASLQGIFALSSSNEYFFFAAIFTLLVHTSFSGWHSTTSLVRTCQYCRNHVFNDRLATDEVPSLYT